MKKLILFITIIFLHNIVFCQQLTDKQQINKVIATFMNCIIKKDSSTFYNLFHEEPIVWLGVFIEKSQASRIQKDSKKKNYFSGNYKDFYRSISNTGADEEKFYNINIIGDESIAAVTFDYSFWESKVKTNWGKESWGLVKINNQWKITSVLFSYEDENINAEPQ